MIKQPLVMLSHEPSVAARLLKDNDKVQQQSLAHSTLLKLMLLRQDASRSRLELSWSDLNVRAWFGFEPMLVQYLDALHRVRHIRQRETFDLFRTPVRPPRWFGTQSERLLLHRLFLWKCVERIGNRLVRHRSLYRFYSRDLDASERSINARKLPTTIVGRALSRLSGWNGEVWSSYSYHKLKRLVQRVYAQSPRAFFTSVPYSDMLRQWGLPTYHGVNRAGPPRSMTRKMAAKTLDVSCEGMAWVVQNPCREV